MAKIIVTGGTGFIGSNVIKQCIKHKSVDEVIVLTRSLIKEELLKSPKVHMILHEEFSQYPDALLEQLQGAQGCIWSVPSRTTLISFSLTCLFRAIGGKVEASPDPETARKVGIGYALVAAETFRDRLAASAAPHKPFRFVFCSAWGAETNQNAKLWVQAQTRKIKGAAETGLFDIASLTSGTFEAYALRPGGVLTEASGLMGAGVSSFMPTVRVDNLGKAFIEVCLEGADKHVLENRDINIIGGLEESLQVNSFSL